MAKTLKHFQEAGHTAYAFIKANPGCCAADVDRARRTARGGHKWMYNTIERLVKRGHVRRERDGARFRLFATEAT